MLWIQKEIYLRPKSRGFHLVTKEIINVVPEIKTIEIGLMHIFIKHTSASLTINENADETVREDFECYFNRYVPEKEPYYQHIEEGADDLPAHLKSSVLGCSLSIPITRGQLNLGVWQGVYLGEHRNNGGSRQIVVTIWGKPF